MPERTYDVTIFGATGFTGGLTADYLAEHAPEGTRWALAGRSEQKLRAIMERLATRARPPSGLVVADVADDASMRALARASRVLITTVGPYGVHGEPVVRACVEEGTDYLDLTGEPEFMDRMIERYDAPARAAGAKIVHACGFDSIPHDLGVLFTLDQLTLDQLTLDPVPRSEPVTIEGFVSAHGGFSGGTWHSAVRIFGDLRAMQRARRRSYDVDGRRVRAAPTRVHFEKEIRGWAVPMPTIDPLIVLRSAQLLDEYGPDFSYGHYLRVRSLPKVVGLAAGAGALTALAQLPPTRRLLLSLREPGQGPSEKQRARSWFRVSFLARAGDRSVVTEVAGGDPGYTETSKMIAEAALCLAHERGRTPAISGVITPAAAMGRPLIERLERAGIAFRRVRG